MTRLDLTIPKPETAPRTMPRDLMPGVPRAAATAGADRWRTPPASWALAIAGAIFATLLRLALAPWTPDGLAFITYYPLVLLVTMLAGLEAGVLAAGLGLFAAWALFIEPEHFFPVDEQSLMKLLAYAAVNGIAIAVVHRLDQLSLRLLREMDRNELLSNERAAVAVAAWESRERLDALIAQVPVGIMEFDLGGKVTLVNDRAAALLGRASEAMVGMRWLELIRDDEREILGGAVDKLIATRRPSVLLTVVDLPGGGSQTIRSHLSLARDLEGRPQAVLNAIEAVEHEVLH